MKNNKTLSLTSATGNLVRGCAAMAAAFAFALLAPQWANAQSLIHVPAIPDLDSGGDPLAGANTSLADGSGLFQPAPSGLRQHEWSWRAEFGNQGILHSLGPSGTPPENTFELVTMVTGLTPFAESPVYALFWSPDAASAVWGVRAGLTYGEDQRENPWFDENSPEVVVASSLGWGAPPGLFLEDNRILLAANLGSATADGDGTIRVFIHDFPTDNSLLRTWYDGVAVVPEPSTYALIGGLAALLAVLVRRLRRSSRWLAG